MILLDTNYLIRALVAESDEGDKVQSWLAANEQLCTSSIAWYEFLCGPVDNEGVDVVRGIIADRVIPFTAEVAAHAARLFAATGRARSRRVDGMIAAGALVAQAALATANREDFRLFEDEGLRLV